MRPSIVAANLTLAAALACSARADSDIAQRDIPGAVLCLVDRAPDIHALVGRHAGMFMLDPEVPAKAPLGGLGCIETGQNQVELPDPGKDALEDLLRKAGIDPADAPTQESNAEGNEAVAQALFAYVRAITHADSLEPDSRTTTRAKANADLAAISGRHRITIVYPIEEVSVHDDISAWIRVGVGALHHSAGTVRVEELGISRLLVTVSRIAAGRIDPGSALTLTGTLDFFEERLPTGYRGVRVRLFISSIEQQVASGFIRDGFLLRLNEAPVSLRRIEMRRQAPQKRVPQSPPSDPVRNPFGDASQNP